MLANLIKLYYDLPVSVSHFLFVPIGFIGIYRWTQYVIKIVAYLLYRPLKPDYDTRKYTPARDVTIVVPTIDHDEKLLTALKSWLSCDPFEIIFITVPAVQPFLEKLGRQADPTGTKIKVITVDKGNKRKQMVEGIKLIQTPITIFCDDDVLWPSTMLDWIIVPFEDDRMGGVGTTQTAMPDGNIFTIWEILANYRLSMRNIEVLATTYIDGGISCLSGRTAAYRTAMVKDPEFTEAFLHEYWRGKYHQHSGDDKFLTRWCQSHDYKTFAQGCKEVELITTFKPNSKFLIQLLRWTRNTWRSDLKALFVEKKIWYQSPYTAYGMFDRLFNPITLLYGLSYFFVRSSTPISTHIPQEDIILTFMLWYCFIRLVKYLPHLVRRPQDLPALPIFVAFQYYFIFLKVYCLLTLHITEWGTRAGADDAAKDEKKGKDAKGKDGKKESHGKDKTLDKAATDKPTSTRLRAAKTPTAAAAKLTANV